MVCAVIAFLVEQKNKRPRQPQKNHKIADADLMKIIDRGEL